MVAGRLPEKEVYTKEAVLNPGKGTEPRNQETSKALTKPSLNPSQVAELLLCFCLIFAMLKMELRA